MDGQITSLLGVAADDLENFAQIYGMTAEELSIRSVNWQKLEVLNTS